MIFNLHITSGDTKCKLYFTKPPKWGYNVKYSLQNDYTLHCVKWGYNRGGFLNPYP